MNSSLSDSHKDRGSFLGESSLKSRSGGLTVAVIYFHHKNLVSKSFLLVTDAAFRAEMWQEVGKTGRRTDASLGPNVLQP